MSTDVHDRDLPPATVSAPSPRPATGVVPAAARARRAMHRWIASTARLGSLLALLAAAPTAGPASADGHAAAEGARPGPIVACEPVANARPICRFENPEDMVPLPGGEALLIGEYGRSAEDHSGGLVLFTLADEQVETVFRGGERPAVAESGWGDPACETPPSRAFNSHGIDLVRREDGRLALLVVQHGGREAVELFEVLGSGADWRVDWRGCVLAPQDASLNEVVGLADGGFYTTKMTPREGGFDFEEGMPDEPTGHAYAWSPKTGYRKIAGTDGIIPNGIEASPDGRIVYMNASGEDSIRKVEVATGKELGRATVRSPDNVTWSPDGRLLVASLGSFDPADFATCQAMTRGACPIPFEIVAVDPETMTSLGPVYASEGPPMGGGTVGLQVGDELFIGSFRGDRILRVDLGAR